MYSRFTMGAALSRMLLSGGSTSIGIWVPDPLATTGDCIRVALAFVFAFVLALAARMEARRSIGDGAIEAGEKFVEVGFRTLSSPGSVLIIKEAALARFFAAAVFGDLRGNASGFGAAGGGTGVDDVLPDALDGGGSAGLPGSPDSFEGVGVFPLIRRVDTDWGVEDP